MSLLLLFSIIIATSLDARKNVGILDIYILDVGQGDSMLIKTPNNYWIVIDTGRDEKAATEISNIMPLLNNNLGFLLITHPDFDHYGGADEILNLYDAKYIFLKEDKNESDAYDTLNQLIQDKNIIEAELNSENDFIFDNLKFNIIWPESNALHSDADQPIKDFYTEEKNDESISLELIYKDFNLLTMGDLSKNYELKAITDLQSRDVDALKLSHHGSKTSTSEELLDNIKPKFGLISVGHNNSYGHPSTETLSIIDGYGLTVYRTDLLGTVHIQTNGSTFLRLQSKLDKKWVEYNL